MWTGLARAPLIVIALMMVAAQAIGVQTQWPKKTTPGLETLIGRLHKSKNTSPAAEALNARLASPESSGATMTPTYQGTDQQQPADISSKKVLVVDIGGTNIKILCTGQTEPRKFPSGRTITPAKMVSGVKELARDWTYDVVAIGYPGRVMQGRIVTEPHNLAPGWVGFDFAAAFGRPVRLMNDAAMQALGSYKSGTLLFLGLGTGLGSALVVEGNVVPMELGHLSYKDRSFEDYVGKQGRKRLGKAKWERHVRYIVSRLIEAIHPDDVVLGGGEAEKLKEPPPGSRMGNNANAFLGGYRLWSGADR